MNEDLMIDLFRKKIVPCDLNLLKSLRVNGLECIVRLFVLVNELQRNVLDLDPQSSQANDSNWSSQYAGYQSGSGGQYYYNQQDNDSATNGSKARFNRFKVNILPQNLEGIKILWSLLEACDTSNSNLFNLV